MNALAPWSASLAVGMLSVSVSVLAGEPDLHAQPMRLRFEPRVILEAVAHRLGVKLRPEIPLPAIRVASSTPLKQFQDAMEPQWRFRPHVFGNSYAVARNEIYLFDAPGLYLLLNGTLDDSLAHEFVHYIQARYWGEDLSWDEIESQAVEVQRWFRDVYAPMATRAVAGHER